MFSNNKTLNIRPGRFCNRKSVVSVCRAVTLLDTTTSESLNWVTFSTGDGTARRGVSNNTIYSNHDDDSKNTYISGLRVCFLNAFKCH